MTVVRAPHPLAPLRRAERTRARNEALVWWAIPLLAVALVAPGVAVAPDVTLVALAGVVATVAAFRWPFVIAITALIAIVSSSITELLLGSVGGPLDEALTLLCVVVFTVRRVWLDRAIVLPAGLSWFLGFALVGLAASLIKDVPAEVWTQQALLSLKGFLLAFAFAQLEWGRRSLKALAVTGVVAAAFFTVTAMLNLFATEAWVDFTKIREPVSVFGIPSLNGPFSQPGAFSRITAIIAIGCLCWMLVARTARLIPLVTFLTMTAISILTVRVKTLTSMVVVYTLFALRARSTWLLLLVLAFLPIAAVTVVPVFVDLVSTDVTTYFFGERDSARSLLGGGAWEIALRDFPFGAGFGRYGTFVAATVYSPEYVARGWTFHYGLGEGTEWGLYLTDTQWPALLGETGWLGTALFAGGLIAMMVAMARKIAPVEPPLYTWIRWSGIGWLILNIIESIGAPVFTSPPAYPFAFIGAGIVAALRYQTRRSGLIPLTEYDEYDEVDPLQNRARRSA